LNNLALAQARRGDTTPPLPVCCARILDPDEEIIIQPRPDCICAATIPPGGRNIFREASDREPENPEDRALLSTLGKAGNKSRSQRGTQLCAESFGPNTLPAVKRKRCQAAAHYHGIDTATLQIGDRFDRSGMGNGGGCHFSSSASPSSLLAKAVRSWLPEDDTAEQAFRAALTTAPHDASAHREWPKSTAARINGPKAIQDCTALELRDSAVDRTTLAASIWRQKNLTCKSRTSAALKIAPNYTEARQFGRSICRTETRNPKHHEVAFSFMPFELQKSSREMPRSFFCSRLSQDAHAEHRTFSPS